MVVNVYYNSSTGSGAQLRIVEDSERREIRVEVTVYDAQAHTYVKTTFAAERYGDALDFYAAAVEKLEAQQ